MAKTLADLIESVASQYGVYVQSDATDGSVNTIEDTDRLLEPDSYFNGMYAYILEDAGGAGAAPEGEHRAITAYSQGDQLLTVSPDFTAAVVAGDTYEILSISRDLLIRQINAAIRESRGNWLVIQRDTTTITLLSDTFSYALPTDLVSLNDLLTRKNATSPWQGVPGRFWWAEGTPGAQTLHFRVGSWRDRLDASSEVMVIYRARPSELTNDTDVLGIGEPAETEMYTFLVHWTLYLLHDRAANRRPQGKEYQAHYTQAEAHRALADDIRGQSAPTERPTGKWKAQNWPKSKG